VPPDWSQLERLLSSVSDWNEWRSANPGIDVQLSAAGLAGSDLAGANLRGAVLEGSRLDGANLRRANLSGAKLFGASIQGINLSGAQLQGADLRACDCSEGDFRDVAMMSAEIASSSFSNCDFSGSDLRGVKARGADFFDSDLSEVDLREADLTSATLSGSRVDRVTLGETILSDVGLWQVEGLGTVRHEGPSWLDPRAASTLVTHSPDFLRGVGWPERLVEYWPSITEVGVAFYSCFISYSHSDARFAGTLHKRLQRNGIRCWLDRHELVPGDDTLDMIDRGIRVYDKTVLVCSKSSLTSWWVDQEIERAIAKERRLWSERGEKVGVLVPIRLDDFVLDGWESSRRESVTSKYIGDFRAAAAGGPLDDVEFNKLCVALRADPHARRVPPTSRL